MIEPTGHRSSDASASDEQRFTELFRAHHAQVLAYCRRRLPHDLADDAVAETFATAWRTLARAPDDQRLWLLGLARGSVANLRRRRDRFARLGDRLATLDQPRPERDHAETTGWQGPSWPLSVPCPRTTWHSHLLDHRHAYGSADPARCQHT